MKKVFLLLGAFLLVFVLAGCEKGLARFAGMGKSKKLVCKMTVEGVETTFNIGFKGNMITTMDFQYYYNLADYTDEQIEGIKKQDFCYSIKDSMPDYKDAFTDCSSKVEEKALNVNAVLDVDKIAKNTLDKMGSIESGKESLEAQGFTRTIE